MFGGGPAKGGVTPSVYYRTKSSRLNNNQDLQRVEIVRSFFGFDARIVVRSSKFEDRENLFLLFVSSSFK